MEGRSCWERLDLELSSGTHPANVRKGLRKRPARPERLNPDDLAAEMDGGVCRAWRLVRRVCVPYRRAVSMGSAAA